LKNIECPHLVVSPQHHEKDAHVQDPQPDFRPVAGQAEDLEPGLRRVLAPNPSPMTYRGTNTYLFGHKQIAVIDPGPNDPTHLQAILAAIGEAKVSHILVTHSHVDHSPLARPLAMATGAPVLAYGPSQAGRSDIMQRLAEQGALGGGEGVDGDFSPDVQLAHGDQIETDEWQLTALHTPGHMANHLCFASKDLLFSGDLVMGWASSLVSPPDGDLTSFMSSCRALLNTAWRVMHAGHGAPITDPNTRLQELIAHREMREAAILDTLALGPNTAAGLAAKIYTETPPALLTAAERNVLAHLIDLTTRKRIAPTKDLSASAEFRVIERSK
jgi:glyoxylase-like metal-dependent hydrolase (beta-lactamase superfamily II)